MIYFFQVVIAWSIFAICMLGGMFSQATAQTEIQELHKKIVDAKKELDVSMELYQADVRKLKEAQNAYDIADKVSATPVRYAELVEREKIQHIDYYYYVIGLPEAIDKELETLERFVNTAYQMSGLTNVKDLNSMDQEDVNKLNEKDKMAYYMLLHLAQKKRTRDTIRQVRGKISPPSFVPQGTDPKEYKKTLEAKCAKIKLELEPLEEIVRIKGEALGIALGKSNQSESHYHQKLFDYYELLIKMHRKYRPIYVKDIEVKVAGGGELIYKASYSDKEKLKELDEKIAFFMSKLQEMQALVREREVLYANAEKNFKESYAAWKRKHEVSTELMYEAYTYKVLLEFGDVMVGSALDGANPASLLFEASHRTMEAFTGDFKLAEPEVPTSLLELRNRLARRQHTKVNLKGAPDLINQVELSYTRNSSEIARWRSMSSAAALFNPDDQLGELKKGGASNTATLFFDELAQKLTNRTGKFHNTSLPHIMAAFMVNPNLDFNDYSWAMQQAKPKARFDELAELVKKGVPTKGNAIIKRLKDVDTYKDARKGFVVGAVVTAAKGPIMDWTVNNRRAEAAAELVMLDMKWMVRRIEYEGAGKVYRAALNSKYGFVTSLGKLLKERDEIARKRKHVIETDIKASTSDSLEISLEFSDEVRDDLQLFASLKHVDEVSKGMITVSIPLKTTIKGKTATATIHESNLKTGSMSIITAGFPTRMDHGPLTVARYSPDLPRDTFLDRLWLDSGRSSYMEDKIKIGEVKLTGPVYLPIKPMPMIIGKPRNSVLLFEIPGEETGDAKQRNQRWADECRKEDAYWKSVAEKNAAFEKKWNVFEERFNKEDNLEEQQRLAQSMETLKKTWLAERVMWSKEGLEYVPTEAKKEKEVLGSQPIMPIEPLQPLEPILPEALE